MCRAVNLLITVLNHVSGAALVGALTLNAANVVGRYVFHSPIYWAEEVTTLLVIWAVCLMSFRLTAAGEHLSADIMGMVLPAQALRWLRIMVAILGTLATAYFSYYAYEVVALVARVSQVTTVAEIPKQYVNGSILVCFGLAALGGLARVWQLLSGEVPPEMPEGPIEVQDALINSETAR